MSTCKSNWCSMLVSVCSTLNILIKLKQSVNPHLWVNWTKPQPLPTGILTYTNSPNCPNTAFNSSSVTLGSKPPTNICTSQIHNSYSPTLHLCLILDTGILPPPSGPISIWTTRDCDIQVNIPKFFKTISFARIGLTEIIISQRHLLLYYSGCCHSQMIVEVLPHHKLG